MELKLGKYKHFKGKEYEVIGIAKNSETLEEFVVYRALYGEYGLWVRPLSMFLEIVEKNGIIAIDTLYVVAYNFLWQENYTPLFAVYRLNQTERKFG